MSFDRREFARQLGLSRFVHGATKQGSPLHPTWNSWRAMKMRCDNPRNKDYPSYGGRGIGYDPAWSEFQNFLSDMGQRPAGMTLDRIDPDLGYDKLNCRWLPGEAQSTNRRERTHCFKGHEFTPENTYVPPGGGHRQCLECRKRRASEYAAAQGGQ